MNRKVISVSPTGQITFLQDPSLIGLMQKGLAVTKRASHIEPVNRVQRWWFHALRCVFGESGRVAEWTRRWKCCWQINMAPSGGPIIGQCQSRAVAIRKEQQWLEQNGFGR